MSTSWRTNSYPNHTSLINFKVEHRLDPSLQPIRKDNMTDPPVLFLICWHDPTMKWQQSFGMRRIYCGWCICKCKISILQTELFCQILQPKQSDFFWTALCTPKRPNFSQSTGWSPLAIIDNFALCSTGIEAFPETFQILQNCAGYHRLGPRPVAIAKQAKLSGIAMHVDYMNWMLTLHLPILGPPAGAGIIVNGVKKDWIPGTPLIIDTTFPHSTYNDTDEDMYLLLCDFWHPDLSWDEIQAMRAFLASNSGV